MTRHPRTVYDAGEDPDPRFSLANERTFLAWTRTALALAAGAVAAHAPALDFPETARLALSSALLLLAGVALGQGWLRWRRTEVAIRTGGPLPGFAGGLVFLGGLVLLVVALLVIGLVSV
ncbi:MAG TPA: DUF202 domain-containing protein [Nocardioides sp.]|nr:DUF202 domain-containing protein [Nocardioides sp.]